MKHRSPIPLGLIFSLVLLSGCSGGDPGSAPSNRAPEIESIVATPEEIAAGDTASIAVTAADPDGDVLAYAYSATGGTVEGAGPQAIWIAPAGPAVHTVAVTVSDGKGGSDEEGVEITVVAAAGGVRGGAKAAAGQAIDLRDARVALYEDDYDHWVLDRWVRKTTAAGSEGSICFEFEGVPPDTYYLDVWKDVDQDGLYDQGDLLGFWGTGEWPNAISFRPLVVVPGQTTVLDTILVRRLPN